MKSGWHDVPVSISITVERVHKSDLPTWIGRSTSLDKIIAEALEDASQSVVWIYNDAHSGQTAFVRKELATIFNVIDDDTIEVEIEAKSTGYYDSASRDEPAEGDDERIIDSVMLVPYSSMEGCQAKNIPVDESSIWLFDAQFDHEIYEVELPESTYEPDIDHLIDFYEEKGNR